MDRKTGVTILDILSMLNRDQRKTIVVVTDDPEVAARGSRTIRPDKSNLAEQEVS